MLGSASWLRLILRPHYDLGTLIGQPTGGAPTEPGEVIYLRLPDSGLRVGLPSKYFIRANGDADNLEKRTVRYRCCIEPLLLVFNLAPASAPDKEPERYAGVTFGLEAYWYAE